MKKPVNKWVQAVIVVLLLVGIAVVAKGVTHAENTRNSICQTNSGGDC